MNNKRRRPDECQKKIREGSGWDLMHVWIFGKQRFGRLQSCTEYKVIPCDIRGYFKILDDGRE